MELFGTRGQRTIESPRTINMRVRYRTKRREKIPRSDRIWGIGLKDRDNFHLKEITAVLKGDF
jgi:hypothetical protein